MTNKPLQNNTAFSAIVKAHNTADGTVKTDITSATSGLEIRFWVGEDGAVTTVAPASQTSTGAHAAGGVVHKYGGNYRVDIAAQNAAGKPVYVTMGGLSGVNFSVGQAYLVPFDTTQATVDANVVSVASGPLTSIRNAILTWEPYTGYSLARLLRVIGITLRGTLSGGGTTTEVLTAPAGGATVTATVDANGNRTVVADTASGTP